MARDLIRPYDPVIYDPYGAPAYWYATDQPARTFPADTGDVADLMGTTAAGVRTAPCAWASDGPDGGRWLAFSSGAGVSISNRLLALPAFSVAATVRFDSLAGDKFVYSEYNGGPVLFLRASSGVAQWWVHNGSAFGQATGPTLTAGLVYRMVGTYAAGVGQKLYLNGALAASSADIGHGTSVSGPNIGSNAGASPLVGRAGNVQVFTRALAAAEVADDYADPFRRLRRPSNAAWLAAAVRAGRFRRVGTDGGMSTYTGGFY